jgi:hypothetical protein
MTREWVDSGDKLPTFFKEEMSYPFPLLRVKKWVQAREFARQFAEPVRVLRLVHAGLKKKERLSKEFPLTMPINIV